MALSNIWHLRTVAESSSKPCYVCYKPTLSVLITPDNKDFFYACRGHLKDRGFCSPVVDEAAKKKEELDREIELVKKEYEEKLAKKKKTKDKKELKEEDQEEKMKEDAAQKEAEKEKDEKIKAISNKKTPSVIDDIPRIYTLHKNFFQMRLDRIRNAEISKRNRERLKNPTAFPSVPSGAL
ncbi:hypothetical protein MMC34_004242 [Xylographa carneopallida]|nr:hypothetical protein [Xylographa carneopallida]